MPFTLIEPIILKKGPSKSKTTLQLADLSGMHVLLVEDNKVNQFLALKLLERMGIKVDIASGGKEAIEFLLKNSYQLILMDVQMPEMNGYELTEYIRTRLPEAQRKIPVIALTAYASLQERAKALELGMSDYITKPYSPHELITAITKQVNLHQISLHGVSNLEHEVSQLQIRKTTDQLINLFNNNVDDVLSLIHMLIHQIPMLLVEIEKALESKNWPLAFQEIHKLRSSVNLLKLSGISNLASELEEYSRDQIHTDRIPMLYEQFKLLCNKSVTLLKEEVIRLKKT